MTQHVVPSVETHIPLTVADLPDEDNDLAVGRPDAPTPSLWQRSVKVKHKATGRPAIVHRVDWSTNMFRAFYPDDVNNEGGIGRFGERTEWEHCRDWDVEVTYSPREIERQAARQRLAEQTARLDAKGMALVTALCDSEDPAKNLAKLEALISAGMVHLDGPEPVELPEEPKPKKGAR